MIANPYSVITVSNLGSHKYKRTSSFLVIFLEGQLQNDVLEEGSVYSHLGRYLPANTISYRDVSL